MNREAVALGTPVYTIFSGRMGAVDEALIADGACGVLDDPGGAGAAQARGPGRRPPPARPASCWSTAVLGAVEDSSLSRSAVGHAHGPTTTDAVFAFLVAAAIAWLLVPYAERLAFRIGADRLPEGAQPARPADAAALRPRDLRRDRGRGLDLAALATARRRSILLGAAAIAAVGVLDDVFELPALPKLLGQIAAALDPGRSAASASTTSPCPSSAASSSAGSPTR